MKNSALLILFIALLSSNSRAQSDKIESFPDALPYSMKTPSNLYLTNHDAESVLAFFRQNNHLVPDGIVTVDEGYSHGYRLCYNSKGRSASDRTADWIKIYTINTQECLDWFQESNPEFLMIPFNEIKGLAGKAERPKDDFTKVYEHYKHVACRLYRQSETPEGEETDELALVMQKYSSKIDLETGLMLASEGDELMMKPVSRNEYNWNLWMQCLDEMDMVGYITLIEYSQIPGSGGSW